VAVEVDYLLVTRGSIGDLYLLKDSRNAVISHPGPGFQLC
jgi:hypothetical protein